jgi:allophanate hydrolase subunit 2
MNSIIPLHSLLPITLQNLGTPLQDSKILGGAMDEQAHRFANYLLGNPQHIPSYEITLGSASFKVLQHTYICLTGATSVFKINGKPQSLWQVIFVKIGDILEISYPTSGVRNYLGIATSNTNCFKFMHTKFIPDYSKPLTLHIFINTCKNNFTKNDINYFLSREWNISTLNNRSVYRLGESHIKPTQAQMFSQGNSFGSVQITKLGEPIIMHTDAPTIGGYPIIGTIFSLDMAKLAQKTTNDIVHFTPITLEEMQQQRDIFNNFFK